MNGNKAQVILRRAALSAMIAGSTAIPLACGLDDGYYAGPPYVVGHYTCVNPSSGMPDYCELLSDGTYQMVPFSIWNTVAYGSVLSFSVHRTWVINSTPYTRAGVAPDVNYSAWHSAGQATTTTRRSTVTYDGMSYRSNKTGRVVYRSASSTGRTASFSSHH